MGFVDRILTIVITATLTSAVWIVAGGSLIQLASDQKDEKSIRPAEAAPSPSPTSVADAENAALVEEGEKPAALVSESLDTDEVTSEEQADDGTLVVPVMNVRPSDLTDTFMDERGSGSRLHEAIDIMAPKGTSVVAAAPGTIEKIFVSDAGGKTLYVRSRDGRTIYYYAHLDKYAEGLKEGQRVRRSQRLGTVGSTGNASTEAPHLHFAIMRTTKDAEWWEPANAVNPYPLLTKR